MNSLSKNGSLDYPQEILIQIFKESEFNVELRKLNAYFYHFYNRSKTELDRMIDQPLSFFNISVENRSGVFTPEILIQLYFSGKTNFDLKHYGRTHRRSKDYHDNIEKAFKNANYPYYSAINLIFCFNCHNEDMADILQQDDVHKRILAVFNFEDLSTIHRNINKIKDSGLPFNKTEYYDNLTELIEQIREPDMTFFQDYYFGKSITVIDNIKLNFYVPEVY